MTQNTKKTWVPIKAPVAVPVYCGSCINFNSHATRTDSKGAPSTCAGLNVGIVEKSKTCRDFSINPFVEPLRQAATNGKLAKLLREVEPSALADLSALLSNEIDTRKAGFHFGQTVYVNVMARGRNATGNDSDYMANYYRGSVVLITADGMAYVSHKTVRMAITVHALLDVDRWAKRREYLLTNNRIVDPNNQHSWARKDVKAMRDPARRPPWLDSAIAKSRERPIDDMTPVFTGKRKRGRPPGVKKPPA